MNINRPITRDGAEEVDEELNDVLAALEESFSDATDGSQALDPNPTEPTDTDTKPTNTEATEPSAQPQAEAEINTAAADTRDLIRQTLASINTLVAAGGFSADTPPPPSPVTPRAPAPTTAPRLVASAPIEHTAHPQPVVHVDPPEEESPEEDERTELTGRELDEYLMKLESGEETVTVPEESDTGMFARLWNKITRERREKAARQQLIKDIIGGRVKIYQVNGEDDQYEYEHIDDDADEEDLSGEGVQPEGHGDADMVEDDEDTREDEGNDNQPARNPPTPVRQPTHRATANHHHASHSGPEAAPTEPTTAEATPVEPTPSPAAVAGAHHLTTPTDAPTATTGDGVPEQVREPAAETTHALPPGIPEGSQRLEGDDLEHHTQAVYYGQEEAGEDEEEPWTTRMRRRLWGPSKAEREERDERIAALNEGTLAAYRAPDGSIHYTEAAGEDGESHPGTPEASPAAHPPEGSDAAAPHPEPAAGHAETDSGGERASSGAEPANGSGKGSGKLFSAVGAAIAWPFRKTWAAIKRAPRLILTAPITIPSLIAKPFTYGLRKTHEKITHPFWRWMFDHDKEGKPKERKGFVNKWVKGVAPRALVGAVMLFNGPIGAPILAASAATYLGSKTDPLVTEGLKLGWKGRGGQKKPNDAKS